jgi:hypothetical protein
MKQKSMAVSVEKMLEKKRMLMKEVRSNYLPLISQSTKSQNDVSISELFAGSRNGGHPSSTMSSDQMRGIARVYGDQAMNGQKRKMSGYNHLMGEGGTLDSRFILAESGKIHDPTTEQIDEEEDDLNFLDNFVESTMSKIRQAKQIVNLGSSSPTYSVSSDSRFKPATAKKYQAVDLDELDDELLFTGQATKSKYAQVAEETPKFSKYAPQQSSGFKQQPPFKFKLQKSSLKSQPPLQDYKDFWVKMFPLNPPRSFVQDQFDLQFGLVW